MSSPGFDEENGWILLRNGMNELSSFDSNVLILWKVDGLRQGMM